MCGVVCTRQPSWSLGPFLLVLTPVLCSTPFSFVREGAERGVYTLNVADLVTTARAMNTRTQEDGWSDQAVKQPLGGERVPELELAELEEMRQSEEVGTNR